MHLLVFSPTTNEVLRVELSPSNPVSSFSFLSRRIGQRRVDQGSVIILIMWCELDSPTTATTPNYPSRVTLPCALLYTGQQSLLVRASFSLITFDLVLAAIFLRNNFSLRIWQRWKNICVSFQFTVNVFKNCYTMSLKRVFSCKPAVKSRIFITFINKPSNAKASQIRMIYGLDLCLQFQTVCISSKQ